MFTDSNQLDPRGLVTGCFTWTVTAPVHVPACYGKGRAVERIILTVKCESLLAALVVLLTLVGFAPPALALE